MFVNICIHTYTYEFLYILIYCSRFYSLLTTEFDNNAVETISERISSYKAALLAAEQSTTARDRKHIPKLQSAVRVSIAMIRLSLV